MAYLPVVYRIITTAWVGALWSVGYLAVPILFASLDDRVLAGALAGRMFTGVAWMGFASGALLLVLGRLGAADRFGRMRMWLIAAMLLLVAIGALVLQPMMTELKLVGIADGSLEAAQFARLHGVSAVLYLLTSLGGLALVGLGSPTARHHA